MKSASTPTAVATPTTVEEVRQWLIRATSVSTISTVPLPVWRLATAVRMGAGLKVSAIQRQRRKAKSLLLFALRAVGWSAQNLQNKQFLAIFLCKMTNKKT